MPFCRPANTGAAIASRSRIKRSARSWEPLRSDSPPRPSARARSRPSPATRPLFERPFPGAEAPVSAKHWAAAIGAYERTLVTKGPFDAFLGGDANALSADARAGLAAFIDTGCAECHAGPLLDGREFKKFGRFFDYVSLTHSDHNDAGRFDVTHAESERAVFKVAALRNVEHTAPYFHDGSVSSLANAVGIMAKAQLNVQLSAPSTAAIVAFLAALSALPPAAFSPPEP
jgi:cytochrome c peroxidase